MGGETLITPGFEDILDALIESNITNITIGFTTNLTVWDDDIIGKLSKFSEVHAGLSIECLHPVNDYVRYPSKLSDVKVILDRWVQIAQELNWLIQLRPTPTNLTIMYLDTLFEYAYTNNLAIESVNFINQPDFMRPSVLPIKTRNIISEKISKWINSKPESNNNVEVVNQRNPNYAKQQVINDAKSYLEYFKNQPDESEKLKDLVSRLKLLESNRKNSIMDYLPEYEELLRSAGY